MDIQWSMMWSRCDDFCGRSEARAGAFSDPLERPEWQGLGWAILPISLLVSLRRTVSLKAPKTQSVERFTKPGAARSVCVP